MYTWAELILPPINLLTYPLQRRDYEMSDIEESGIGSHYETTVKPVWKAKPHVTDQGTGADATQVDGNHYKEMSIQPWEAMEVLLTPEKFIGFLEGNYLKYLMRDGKKYGSVKDADKARHYAAKLAEIRAK